jgi:hypothetical protein
MSWSQLEKLSKGQCTGDARKGLVRLAFLLCFLDFGFAVLFMPGLLLSRAVFAMLACH